MFSVLFPGQGSQSVGMAKDLYDNFQYIKDLFNEADDTLSMSISKLIFEGPKEVLNETENTQPAIFLVSYAIFKAIKNETSFDISKASFFAGHSLGEYSAIACAGYLDFQDTIKILKIRGNAMQNSMPKGEGGMLAVLGTTVENIENILKDNQNNFKAEIANDNSEGQIVLSGKTNDLEKLSSFLKENKIKNIKLPVSAPFHCELIQSASKEMSTEISNYKFSPFIVPLYSNVTAKICDDKEIANLLINQITSKVRWREIVENMVYDGIKIFVEIGPGSVLTNLVKRISNDVITVSISKLEDIEKLDNIKQ